MAEADSQNNVISVEAESYYPLKEDIEEMDGTERKRWLLSFSSLISMLDTSPETSYEEMSLVVRRMEVFLLKLGNMKREDKCRILEEKLNLLEK